MTGKTECCGWDVWAELAGMVYDRRIPSAEEWPAQRDNQSVPAIFSRDPQQHPHTVLTAHENR